jgi:hypothetical protein
VAGMGAQSFAGRSTQRVFLPLAEPYFGVVRDQRFGKVDFSMWFWDNGRKCRILVVDGSQIMSMTRS